MLFSRSALVVSMALLFMLLSCKGKMYRYSTGAMEETIMPGDPLYVQQTKNFNRNDIVAFDFWGQDYTSPMEESGKFKMKWQRRIYRLIAFSGDVLNIKNGEIFINGVNVSTPPGALFDYDVLSTTGIDDFPERDEPSELLYAQHGDTLHYIARLTATQAEDYSRRKPAIISVKKRLTEYTPDDTALIQLCQDCKWTTDSFGPVSIPVPGDRIMVDSLNFKLYQNIPAIHFGENVLAEKLYFVMGDNRHASQDSRFIGFISHSKMYGTVK